MLYIVYHMNRGRPRKKEEEKIQPNEKIECEICGGKYLRTNKSKHVKTNLHVRNLKKTSNILKNKNDLELIKKILTINENNGIDESKKYESSKKHITQLSSSGEEESSYEEQDERTYIEEYFVNKYGKFELTPKLIEFIDTSNHDTEQKIKIIDKWINDNKQHKTNENNEKHKLLESVKQNNIPITPDIMNIINDPNKTYTEKVKLINYNIMYGGVFR